MWSSKCKGGWLERFQHPQSQEAEPGDGGHWNEGSCHKMGSQNARGQEADGAVTLMVKAEKGQRVGMDPQAPSLQGAGDVS